MQNDKPTYTYTARNAHDPNQVVTLTHYDGHLRVNLTGLVDQAQALAGAEEKSEAFKHQMALQAKPAVIKLKENLSAPVHLGDVHADLEEDQFKIALWPRVGGLRLEPVRFDMGRIDNPDAAKAFVDELEERQSKASESRKFFGPLDYWIGRAGLLLVIGLIIRRPKQA